MPPQRTPCVSGPLDSALRYSQRPDSLTRVVTGCEQVSPLTPITTGRAVAALTCLLGLVVAPARASHFALLGMPPQAAQGLPPA